MEEYRGLAIPKIFLGFLPLRRKDAETPGTPRNLKLRVEYVRDGSCGFGFVSLPFHKRTEPRNNTKRHEQKTPSERRQAAET